MLNKSNVNNFQIKLDEISDKRTQNKILLEKLDNEALEFELQRNHDRYLLGLDRFNSLKDNARFQLGVLGLIGTVVMTILFSIVGVKQFFETTDMNDVLFIWGGIFIGEVIWLLITPFLTRQECILSSRSLMKNPEFEKSNSDGVYDKRKIIIEDICDYKYNSELFDTIFKDSFYELNKNEVLIFTFIFGTIFSIFFFFTFGLLPVVSTCEATIVLQIIIIIDIILIFLWQLFPVIFVIYDFLKEKYGI